MSTTSSYYITIYYPDGTISDGSYGPILEFTITGSGMNDITAVSDGITINDPMQLTAEIMWQMTNNPSSLQLDSTTFEGVYQPSNGAAASTTNLIALLASKQTAFTEWSAVYNGFQEVSTSPKTVTSLGQLVVASSGVVTFAGTVIKNPIFLMQKTSQQSDPVYQLAWFTSDGNGENVAISFTTDSDDSSTLLFFGYLWSEGDNRPDSPTYNFYGTTQNSTDAQQQANENLVDGLANIAEGVAAMMVIEAAKAAYNAVANKNEAADDAENAADDETGDAQDADQNAADDANAENEAEVDDAEVAENVEADPAADAAEDAIVEFDPELSLEEEKAPKKGKRGRSAEALIRLKHRKK